ncbi:hypothetical protein SAMN04487895_101596 [Paenibacillus sophorae]|uniref:Uncharacterized protein n=1 Tax=Paenibacillus sophorae TaxID=1333845 RepID=A0A1H8GPD8_9BACL|nr:hypothetical protein SAMN04487895_101596 [Paenibacillus sophorae]
MDTKIINSEINKIIGSNDFKEMIASVSHKLFSPIDGNLFSEDDDLRLIMTRIRDSFVAGLNYESCKWMLKIKAD